MKKKVIKATMILNGDLKPMTCRCHPSGKSGYVIYKTPNKELPAKYNKKIEISFNL